MTKVISERLWKNKHYHDIT